MRIFMVGVVLVGLAASAGEARAGGLGIPAGTGERVGKEIGHGISLATDLGLEGGVWAAATQHHIDAVSGGDVVIAVFQDPILDVQDQVKEQVKEQVKDRVLGKEPEKFKLRYAWPFLSRPIFELHVGGLFALDGDFQQLHLSLGTGLGWLGVGAGGEVEWNDAGAAFAVGLELRVRHRFGPREKSPSVGVVLRADVFAHDRDTHADRLSLGVVGMFDIL
jgi:hypothetical protein